MVLERPVGNLMLWFTSRLLRPTEMSTRRHGNLLIMKGSLSFITWLATIVIALWLFNPPKTKMPDIGRAMTGPPAHLTEMDHERIRHESKVFGYLIALPLLAVVFWRGYSSLMIGVGIFERFAEVPFGKINDWFNQLHWFKKIVSFPLLLAAMIVVIGMPFVVLAVIGEWMDL